MRGAEDREEEERPVVRSRGGAGLNSGMFKGLCRLNALSDHCSLGPHSSLLFGRRLFPRREERRRAKEKDARPARVCFPSRGAWCDSPGRVTGARFLTGVPSERRAFQRSDGGGRRLHLRPRRYRGVARQARARLADDRRGDGELRPHPEPRRRCPHQPARGAHPKESDQAHALAGVLGQLALFPGGAGGARSGRRAHREDHARRGALCKQFVA
mmetsp:Transcript_30786/g.90009  ORF Transcript_30786/g.90009 Transcript_30786/m.90009 type:complete len:214 (-) Transcript_30786:521-1162(-)